MRLRNKRAGRYTALMMALLFVMCAGPVTMPPACAAGGALTAVYVYDGSKITYRDEDAQNIDQMFYSFALFVHGHVSVAHWKRVEKFQEYVQKHPSLTPIFSVGGWGADGFSQAAATSEGREAFAGEVLTTMQTYGFQGVDIDWEYPGSSTAGIASSPEDRENYTLLLQAVREALDAQTALDGVPRRLCIAISGSPERIPSLECVKIGSIVDQVNLMTYDMHEEDTASHHSALYKSHVGALSANACVRAYIAAGIPADKLMLGAAFYGQRWTTQMAQPLYQHAIYKDTLPYTAILKLIKKKPAAVFYDDVAQAPYYFDGKAFISYDDEHSIAQKAAYVRQNGLLGLFAWEYGADATGTLVGAMRP
ncbi:MAG: chitinase [Eubacteriales bacterium]|nr:chitinase [Eubacteriales bacterium]